MKLEINLDRKLTLEKYRERFVTAIHDVYKIGYLTIKVTDGSNLVDLASKYHNQIYKRGGSDLEGDRSGN